MSISVVLGFKSKNISGFDKQNPLKQQNQLYFGANISKIVTESADEVMVGIKKLAPDSIDEITQGVKKKLTLDSIQDVFQGAKKKPAINMGEDEVLSIRQKIKKVAQKIKESISDVFKKRSKFSTRSAPQNFAISAGFNETRCSLRGGFGQTGQVRHDVITVFIRRNICFVFVPPFKSVRQGIVFVVGVCNCFITLFKTFHRSYMSLRLPFQTGLQSPCLRVGCSRAVNHQA